MIKGYGKTGQLSSSKYQDRVVIPRKGADHLIAVRIFIEAERRIEQVLDTKFIAYPFWVLLVRVKSRLFLDSS
jgi:hypothetical protein